MLPLAMLVGLGPLVRWNRAEVRRHVGLWPALAAALLQGLVRCGHCGRPMRLSYGERRRGRIYQYRWTRARQRRGGPDCQVIGGKRIDQRLVDVFLEGTRPCARDAARLANEEARREREALGLYWAHQIEKVQDEAQRAQRYYLAVEPENRTVARELERRWKTTLREPEQVQTKAERTMNERELLSAEELARFGSR